eukprot:scaffold55719_cov86-Attheya_sp.AAC.2
MESNGKTAKRATKISGIYPECDAWEGVPIAKRVLIFIPHVALKYFYEDLTRRALSMVSCCGHYRTSLQEACWTYHGA